jgi:uncharacterized protein (TIGR02265 family)
MSESTLIKGTSLLARHAYVDRFGASAWDRVLAQLSGEEQERLGGLILPVAMYPLTLAESLDRAIASALAPDRDPVEIFRELGKQSASQNLEGMHRAFLHHGETAHALLARFPSVRRQYYSDGEATYEHLGETHARLVVKNAGTVTVADCISTAAFFERGLEMVGVHDVRITHEVCRLRGAAACESECSWREPALGAESLAGSASASVAMATGRARW